MNHFINMYMEMRTMATKIEQINFIKEIGPLAVKVAKEQGLGNAQIWTCIAQACDESAYGTSKRMRNSNAYFGIKANKHWIDQAKYGGLVYDSKTKECYDGKTYSNITACFRAYKNMEDSVRDYFDLLHYNRYKNCLTKTNVKDCITAIKAGGYATAPDYINTIYKFYTTHKELIESYRVDEITKPTIVKKSNDEIAYEVCRGLWGNGSERKRLLTQSGYNYTEIQKIVNQMLR